MNLLSNALKFTIKGYVKVIMESSIDNNQNEYITVSVEDSGIGIPEED